jgi:hypothetical protein
MLKETNIKPCGKFRAAETSQLNYSPIKSSCLEVSLRWILPNKVNDNINTVPIRCFLDKFDPIILVVIEFSCSSKFLAEINGGFG